MAGPFPFELAGLAGEQSLGKLDQNFQVTIATVPNAAALRQLTTTQPAIVYLPGGVSLQDGMQGAFGVDLGDTTSADNGDTVLVDAAGHRWKRLSRGVPTIADMLTAGILTTDGTLSANSDQLIPTEKAVKTAIDTATSALQRIGPVDVAATSPVTLSGEQTIGGFTTSGSRVLTTAQADGKQNLIYVSDPGAWTIAGDASTGAEIVGAQVLVLSGADAGHIFACKTPGPITVGTTSIAWQDTGAGTAYSAGTGLALTGNQFAIDTTIVPRKGVAQTFTAQQTLGTSASGSLATPAILQNTATYAAGATLSLPLQASPTNDARLEARATSSTSSAVAVRVQSGGSLTDAVVFNPDRTAVLPGYVTPGLLSNDGSGHVATTTVGTGLALAGGVLSISASMTQPWTALQTFQAGIAVSGAAGTFARPSGADALQLINSSLTDRAWGLRSVTRGSDGDLDFVTGPGNSVAGTVFRLRGDGKAQLPQITNAGLLGLDSSGIASLAGGPWTTVNMAAGGVLDTSALGPLAFITIHDTGAATGVVTLGEAAPGSIRVVRVDAPFDWFFNRLDYPASGNGAVLTGFQRIPANVSGEQGRWTQTTYDTITMIATGSVNAGGKRVWLCIGVVDNFTQNIFRFGGSGHIDPPDKQFLVGGNSKGLNTHPLMPAWSGMIDPTAINGVGRLNIGDVNLTVYGDTPRIQMRGLKTDGGGNPVLTSLFPNWIGLRPGVLNGSGQFETAGAGAPQIPGSISSAYQGICARLDFDVLYDPTMNSTAGALIFSTATGTQDGDTYGVTPWNRQYIHCSGNTIIVSKAAYEAGDGGWHAANVAAQKSPAGFLDYKTYAGDGALTVVMTNISTGGNVRNNAVIAMRACDNLGRGVDLGWDGTDFGWYTVNGGTRTRILRIRPTSAGDITWENFNQHTYNVNTLAGVAAPVRYVNTSGVNGAGIGIQFQAGSSTSNNSAYVNAVNDGSGDVSLQFQVAPNGAAVTAITAFASRVVQLNGYGAGTLVTNSSGVVSASSDDTLKIMEGSFEDSLPADLDIRPGETRAMAAFRAIGDPQVWRWNDEEAAITAAIDALPALLEARGEEDDERKKIVAKAEAQRTELVQAEAAAQTGWDALAVQIEPLAELERQAEALKADIEQAEKEVLVADARKGAAKSAAQRNRADADVTAALARRQTFRDRIAALPEHVQELKVLRDRGDEARQVLKDATEAVHAFDQAHDAKLAAFDQECAGRANLIETAARLAMLYDPHDENTTRYVGTTAQQLQKGAPIGVKVGPDGKLTKDDRAELALQSLVIRDLMVMVADLKDQVAALKAA